MDLDAPSLVQSVGDEATILPRRLSRTLSEALKLAACLPGGDPAPGVASVMLAETLLRLFVEVCGHYRAHLTTQQDGRPVLQVRRGLSVEDRAGRTARAAGETGLSVGDRAGRTARAAGEAGCVCGGQSRTAGPCCR